ncbi:translocation/assembly module TamB domain-containing protein [Sediminitomix flava]|uniref:Uncharacterized protein DUF490 n=1 Tax=Sediminitomix flava TaxID=379075 RepID=A0A315ZB07_SEDFL|nr:translocation/assembly module TamB domain-containing protein [Sediminitomix flava]PWJ42339.1 uncharacterized protein DUF490 [Sediminitomix flava]
MTNKTTLLKKILRITLRIVIGIFLGILFLLFLISLILKVPFLQTKIVHGLSGVLKDKLQTELSIGKIALDFPESLTIDQVYIEDLQQDTLVYIGHLSVGFKLLPFLHNTVHLDDVEIEDVTVKLIEYKSDSLYNYQFIIDAFTSDSTTTDPVEEDTTASNLPTILAKHILLENISFRMGSELDSSDMQFYVGHFSSGVEIDLNKGIYDISETGLKNTWGSIILANSPDQEPEKEVEADSTPIDMTFNLKSLDASNISYKQGDTRGQMLLDTQLPSAEVQNLSVSLFKQSVDGELLEIEGCETNIQFLPTNTTNKDTLDVADNEKPTDGSIQELFDTGWDISLKKGELNKIAFSLNDYNVPEMESGMDYSHMVFDDIYLEINEFVWKDDRMNGKINSISLKEHNGFNLKGLQTSFIVSSYRMSLNQLFLQTSVSRITGNLDMQTPNGILAMTERNGVYFDIDLPNTKIGEDDIFTFAPFLKEQAVLDTLFDNNLNLSADINGGFDSLIFHKFEVGLLSGTDLALNGYLLNLLEVENIGGDVDKLSLVAPPKDLKKLQSGLGLYQLNLLNDSLLFNTDFYGDYDRWSAKVNLKYGRNKVILDAERVQNYNTTLNFKLRSLGYILKIPELGLLNGKLKLNSSDIFWSDSLATTAKLKIKKFEYDSVALEKSKIKLTVDDEVIYADWSLITPFVTTEGNSQVEIKDSILYVKPSLRINDFRPSFISDVDSSMQLSLALDGNFIAKDVTDLNAKLKIFDIDLAYKDQLLTDKRIDIAVNSRDSVFRTDISGDLLDIEYKMTSPLERLGDDFQNMINHYYPISDTLTDSTATTFPDLDLKFQILDFSFLDMIDPNIKIDRMEPITISLDSDTKEIEGKIDIVNLSYSQYTLDSITCDIMGNEESVGVDLVFHDLSPSDSIGFDSLEFQAELKDKKLFFDIYGDDQFQEDFTIFDFGFQIEKPDTINIIRFNEDFTIRNRAWNVDPKNRIDLYAIPYFDNFILEGEGRKLDIQSSFRNGVQFTDLRIDRFSLDEIFYALGLAEDSIRANLSTELILIHKDSTLDAEGKLSIEDIAARGQSFGDFRNEFKYTDQESVEFDLSLEGEIGNISLVGDYPFEEGQTISTTLSLAPFNYAPLNVFAEDFIEGLEGELNGKIAVSGDLGEPKVRGGLDFTSSSFFVTPLDVPLEGNGGKIDFDEEGIHIDELSFVDSMRHGITLDGDIFTEHYQDFKMDMKLSVNEFTALDSKKKEGVPYFGKFIVSTETDIKGTFEKPRINTKLDIINGTNTTYIFSSEGENNRGEDVIQFRQKDQEIPEEEKITGMDLEIDIGIEEEVTFKILLDERTGDMLSVQGGGDLLFELDSTGNMSLNGKFEVTQGSYDLTLYKVIPKSFELDKGSFLYWSGDITSPLIDITATYRVKASPSQLIESYMQSVGGGSFDSNRYSKRRLFDVKMKMSGYLDNPDLSFDILYPVSLETNDSDNTIDQALSNLRDNPNVLNKQVFGLLALGAFIPVDEAMNSSSINEATSGLVSNFLSDRLNEFSSDFIKGFDLNFDVEQYNQENSSGQSGTRTDVGVSVKKNLFNERLTILVGGAVAVQDEVQNETNSFSTDVEVEYKIKKDGRLRIKAYSENSDTNFGNDVYKNGLSLLFQKQYTKFKELFEKTPQEIEDKRLKKEKKQKRKEERRRRKNKKSKDSPVLKEESDSLQLKEDQKGSNEEEK